MIQRRAPACPRPPCCRRRLERRVPCIASIQLLSRYIWYSLVTTSVGAHLVFKLLNLRCHSDKFRLLVPAKRAPDSKQLGFEIGLTDQKQSLVALLTSNLEKSWSANSFQRSSFKL